MDTSTPSLRREPQPFGRLARAVLVLAVALAGAAAVAAPCSRNDLTSTQVPLAELRASIVDLGDADTGEDATAGVGLTESMAPLLYLTPRVTSILEEVFDDTEADPAVESPDPQVEPASPVAEAEIEKETASRHYGPLSQADNAAHLPKFQRQMYRTDI